MHEGCSFVGTYKRLKKHVKSKHRSSKPREVDPARLAEWEEFENEKERQDAISIVSALNPGSVIMGDYIIDPDSDISDPYNDNSLDDFSDSTRGGAQWMRNWAPAPACLQQSYEGQTAACQAILRVLGLLLGKGGSKELEM